ncbi:MAG: hypothetical protein NC905_07710 [Candidatus Omnitrophica bacterium]|nr:hypothetical protein [Candidatus Omnitrophota bacterium]MCM8778123.1 hypothetical protein [Candidatus Omnitrophota bacterium]
MNKDTHLWKNIKISGTISFMFPLLLMIIGIVLSRNGFTGLVKNYEEGAVRFVQYILFAIGAGIFFFCDGISDFFYKRVSLKDIKDKTFLYLIYILFIMGLLDIISITGFIGFLICGNISWLAVFVILNLSIGIKYFPSRKKMQRLIEKAG